MARNVSAGQTADPVEVSEQEKFPKKRSFRRGRHGRFGEQNWGTSLLIERGGAKTFTKPASVAYNRAKKRVIQV